MEPLDRGAEFEFVNEMFGGAIPRNYIPAIEKGMIEAAANGYLAGYPVVDFKVTVYDGSYHDVDSSEMAFKLAARKAFKAAMAECQAGAAGAGDERGSAGSRGVCRRSDGRHERPPRPDRRHGHQGRDADHSRPGADVGDAELPERPDLDDAGARIVHDGVRPLRLRAVAAGGKIIAAAKAAKAGIEEEEE